MRDSQGKLPIDLTLDPDMKEIIEMTGSHVSKAQLLETLKNRMMIKPVVYNMVFIGGGTGKSCRSISVLSFRRQIFMYLPLFYLSEEHQVCRQAAKELGIKVSHTLTEAVTHLVICDGDKEFADPGEHLFYEAMLMGKWVVNLDWIKDSRREKEIQTELAYEFNGVRGKPEGGLVSARRNSAGKLPRLLDGCHIYLYGEFRLNNTAECLLFLRLQSGFLLRSLQGSLS